MVAIRLATAADAASLAALAESTFRETFAAENSPESMDLHCAQSFGADIQGREIADPQSMTFLAEVDGILVGFAQLRLAQPSNLIPGTRPSELRRIYVCNEWHGRGVARELMRAVVEAAAQEDSDWLWLGVWERNPRAIAFYRKRGFRVVGDHGFMLGREQQRDLILAAEMNELLPAP